MDAHYKQQVEHNWFSLKYVPIKLRTLELCTIAMKQNKKAIEFVPDELKEHFIPKEDQKEEVKIKSKKEKSK